MKRNLILSFALLIPVFQCIGMQQEKNSIEQNRQNLDEQFSDACRKGRVELVKQLLQQGAVSQDQNFEAAKTAELVELILKTGFKPGKGSIEKAFKAALQSDDIAMINVLQKYKLPVSSAVLKLLNERFCKNNQDESVEFFLRSPIVVTQEDFDSFIENVVGDHLEKGEKPYKGRVNAIQCDKESQHFKNIYLNFDDYIEEQKMIGWAHDKEIQLFEKPTQIKKFKQGVISKINPKFDATVLFIKKLSEATGLGINNNVVKCLFPVFDNPLVNKYFTDKEYEKSKINICAMGHVNKLYATKIDMSKQSCLKLQHVQEFDLENTLFFNRPYGIKALEEDLSNFERFMHLAIIHGQLDIAKALILKKLESATKDNVNTVVAKIKEVIKSITKMQDSFAEKGQYRCDLTKYGKSSIGLALCKDKEIMRLDLMQQDLKRYLCNVLYLKRMFDGTQLPVEVVDNILEFCPKLNWISDKQILTDMAKEQDKKQ